MISQKRLHKNIDYDVAAIIEGGSELSRTKAFKTKGHEKLELGSFGVLTNTGFIDCEELQLIPIIAVVHKYDGKSILSWDFYKGYKDYGVVNEWLKHNYPTAKIFNQSQIEDLLDYCDSKGV